MEQKSIDQKTVEHTSLEHTSDQKVEQSKVMRTKVLTELEIMAKNQFLELPEHYKQCTYMAIDKLYNLPMISLVDPGDITKALLKMFVDRLDYTKNHCYLFVAPNKNKPTGYELRYAPQYQGLIYIAKMKCNVIDVRAVLVYEDDIFETHYHMGEMIIDRHVPSLNSKAIKGGYCVIEYPNNRFQVKYLNKDELDQRRNASKAPEGNFWKWEREMYEKTLIRASVTRLIETHGEISNDILYAEENNSINNSRQIEDAEIISQDEPSSFNLDNKIKI